MGAAERLVPGRPFPAYTFVPGRNPHPVSDPAGHSHGIEPPIPDPIDPDHWAACEPYLYGLDLFNAGYYWECHGELEALWIAAGKHGPVADLLKGLIKLAAAGVKHAENRPAGVQSHAVGAGRLFRQVGTASGKAFLLGLEGSALIELAEAIEKDGWPETPPVLVPRKDP